MLDLLGKTLLFTDHGQDWSDEAIVLGYRAQHHVEGDFRYLKNPLFLSFRPTFHWTDQKLRVHAFYCVLALMMLNLLRRRLAQAGISISMVEMMKQLTNIQEVTVLYSATKPSQEPLARIVLSKINIRQQKMITALGSSAIATIRSYLPNPFAPAPGAARQQVFALRLVNSG